MPKQQKEHWYECCACPRQDTPGEDCSCVCHDACLLATDEEYFREGHTAVIILTPAVASTFSEYKPSLYTLDGNV